MSLLDRALQARQPVQAASTPAPTPPAAPAPQRHDVRDPKSGRYTVAKRVRVRNGKVV